MYKHIISCQKPTNGTMVIDSRRQTIQRKNYNSPELPKSLYFLKDDESLHRICINSLDTDSVVSSMKSSCSPSKQKSTFSSKSMSFHYREDSNCSSTKLTGQRTNSRTMSLSAMKPRTSDSVGSAKTKESLYFDKPLSVRSSNSAISSILSARDKRSNNSNTNITLMSLRRCQSAMVANRNQGYSNTRPSTPFSSRIGLPAAHASQRLTSRRAHSAPLTGRKSVVEEAVEKIRVESARRRRERLYDDYRDCTEDGKDNAWMASHQARYFSEGDGFDDKESKVSRQMNV